MALDNVRRMQAEMGARQLPSLLVTSIFFRLFANFEVLSSHLIYLCARFSVEMPASSTSSSDEKRSYASVPLGPPSSNGRIPVTPGVLRSIFASSRTAMEERSISRVAFFRCVRL